MFSSTAATYGEPESTSLQNGVDLNTPGHYSAGFTLDTHAHATQRILSEM